MASKKTVLTRDANITPEVKNKPASMREPVFDFPIVGIGASAGGLEAFSSFLQTLPAKTGMAFILIQHLDPSQPSRLTELLAKTTAVPVQEVDTETRILPNHVYIIPPGSDMIIKGRNLLLQTQPEHPGLTHSIDVFFSSLGQELHERAAAVILSGTGSDGTEGAKVVKAAHGLVIVQDPESAKYDGMPRAAITAGLGDYVLKPEKIGEQLVNYYGENIRQREDFKRPLEKDTSGLRKILELVHLKTGRDFSGYKTSSIVRRIEHRMAVNQFEKINDYVRLLKEQPSEIDELLQDFLINVTSFFRDSEAFEALKKVMCAQCKKKPVDEPMRVWVPGCATGEEVYSLAMVMMECCDILKRHHDIQLFGTDLDNDTILTARAGIYADSISSAVSAERLNRFFIHKDSTYQIKKEVRDKIVFAVHDIVTDPPYSRMDLVSMRNLLIYFDTDLQKKIIPMLHYSLNNGGILFLGTAETVGEVPDIFKVVDSKWRIYQSINKKNGQHLPLPGQQTAWRPKDIDVLQPVKIPASVTPMQLLLEALPPSVMIDRNYQVVFTHDNTSRYLHVPEGNPSSSILEMANDELKTELATALHEAAQGQKQVTREIPRIKQNGGVITVKITVRPLRKMDGSMIVTFEDKLPLKRSKINGEPLTEARHLKLEQELQLTRDTLHGTIAELETTNEELRTANEEYMSTNEELKSANEELETSREELRSVNEELTTINAEREKKIEELITVSDDMRNLLNSTDIATIFLDEKLRIRRFTPSITTLFKLIASDVGRPLADITTSLKTESLFKSAQRVLEKLTPVEQEVRTKAGRWYSMRIHPYRTTDNAIEGIVVTFIDINVMKAALAYNQSIIDTVQEPLMVLSEELKVISASRAFYDTFQVNKTETEGEFLYNLGNNQWDIPVLRKTLKEVLQKGKVFVGIRIEHDFPGIGKKVMLANARRVFDGVRATQNILLTLEDITKLPEKVTENKTKDTHKGNTRE